MCTSSMKLRSRLFWLNVVADWREILLLNRCRVTSISVATHIKIFTLVWGCKMWFQLWICLTPLSISSLETLITLLLLKRLIPKQHFPNSMGTKKCMIWAELLILTSVIIICRLCLHYIKSPTGQTPTFISILTIIIHLK